jgi:hypothetical protein
MSYEPADYAVENRQIAAGASTDSSAQLSSSNNRGLRKFLSVLVIASSVAACTGGAGLDIPIQPVDHSCAHDGADRVLGGDSSGCS